MDYKANSVVFYVGNDWMGGTPDPDAMTQFLTATRTYFWTQIEIELPNSIQDAVVVNEKSVVTVYPNPVKDVLFIETEQTVRHVYVFDLSGKLVMHVQGDGNSINMQSLSAGNYVARIHTDKAVVSVKIVKK
jgi:hypothetical protein